MMSIRICVVCNANSPIPQAIQIPSFMCVVVNQRLIDYFGAEGGRVVFGNWPFMFCDGALVFTFAEAPKV